MGTNPIPNKDFPEGLKKFRENYKNKYGRYPDGHNMYILESYDREGNKTAEAYGLNVLTNTGMTRNFGSDVNSGNIITSITKLFIGSGTTDPTPTDTTLETPITTTAATTSKNDNGVSQYGYLARFPMTYDSDTDTLSQAIHVYTGYFDYNLSGVTEDKEIHELGLGDSITNLWTHAKVYDVNVDGVSTPIKKKINERLIIKVLVSASYKVGTTISDLYDKGVYLTFEPSIFLRAMLDSNYATRYFSSVQRIYGVSRTPNDTAGTHGVEYDRFLTNRCSISGNVATSTPSFGSDLIQKNGSYISKIVIGNIFYPSGSFHYYYELYPNQNLLIIEGRKCGVKLPSPEELVFGNLYTENHKSSRIIPSCVNDRDRFILDTDATEVATSNVDSTEPHSWQYLPVSQMNIKSCMMYNHSTKQWDISETAENNPDYDYDAAQWFYYLNPYMSTPDGNKSVRIFTNRMTEFPITSLNVSGVKIYATDKYWDPASWVEIDDTLHVAEALQRKRYYIDSSDTKDLRPTYDCTKHGIITTNQPKEITVPDTQKYGIKSLVNDTLGYFTTFSSIVFPDGDEPIIYGLKCFGDDTNYSSLRWNTKDGSRILMLSNTTNLWNNEKLRVYTITDSSSEPTFHDVTLNFTGTTNQSTNMRTFTRNGFYCSQNKTEKSCVILDIVGDADGVPTQYELTNIQHCYAMDFTDNCVYLKDDSDGLVFEIYDMRNKTVVKSFTIETGFTFTGIVGWNNIVYVRTKKTDGTYVTHVYDADNDQMSRVSDVDFPNMDVVYDSNIGWIIGTSTNGSTKIVYGHYPICAEDCMVLYQNASVQNYAFRKDDYKVTPYVFMKSQPDTPKPVFTANSVNYSNMYFYLDNMYNDSDGKHVYLYGNGWLPVFGYSYPSCEPRVIDIGRVIDTGQPDPEFLFNRQTPNPAIGGDYSSYLTIAVYKNYLIYQKNLKESSNKYEMYPIENFVPHKLTIETDTIQSYNNPKRLRNNRTHTFRITNDLSKWAY